MSGAMSSSEAAASLAQMQLMLASMKTFMAAAEQQMAARKDEPKEAEDRPKESRAMEKSRAKEESKAKEEPELRLPSAQPEARLPTAPPKPKVGATKPPPRTEDSTSKDQTQKDPTQKDPKIGIRKVGAFRLDHGTLEIFARFYPDEPVIPRPLSAVKTEDLKTADGSAAPKTPPIAPPEAKLKAQSKQRPGRPRDDDPQEEQDAEEEPQLGANQKGMTMELADPVVLVVAVMLLATVATTTTGGTMAAQQRDDVQEKGLGDAVREHTDASHDSDKNMEEMAEKTPQSKSPRGTPIKVKRKLFDSPATTTKKLKRAKTPKKSKKVASKGLRDEESEKESDDDDDDRDLFNGPFARAGKAPKSQACGSKAPPPEDDTDEEDSEKAESPTKTKEAVPEAENEQEDSPRPIDDMLLALLPASSSKSDVPHFSAILRSEDILTLEDAMEAISDLTGDWTRQLGETARLAADSLTLKGKRALMEHAAKVAAGESQEIEQDSNSHASASMFFRHYLTDHEYHGL
ncbi:unnamed protein product [Symbiodinium sp. CCMP2456]|nr:unnamed protein product [Symbiodinium sp. CCMP2456]